MAGLLYGEPGCSCEFTEVCVVDAYSALACPLLKIEVADRWLPMPLSSVEALLAFESVRLGELTLLEGLSIKSKTLFGLLLEALRGLLEVDALLLCRSKAILPPGTFGIVS